MSPARATLVLAAAAMLAACATSPRTALAELDRKDPAYRSGKCVAARKAAARFAEHKEGRAAIGVVGNLIVPFAGTAASALIAGFQEDDKAALNHRLRSACVSDPLAGKRKGARRVSPS